MAVSPFLEDDIDIDALFLQSLFEIEEAALNAEEVCGFLESCCSILSRLPGLSGATIAVTDGHDNVLHHLSSGYNFLLSSNPFENLRRLRDVAEKLRNRAWAEIPSSSSSQRATSGYLLSLHGKEYGMVFLQRASLNDHGEDAGEATGSRNIVTKLAPHLAKHIKLGLIRRERDLHRGLQEFATVELTPRVPSPKKIVDSLSELLEAKTCTLFIQELGKLYLSATNDSEVESTTFNHTHGQGLTDLVLRMGKAIQIFDTADDKEVRAVTGLDLDEDFARPTVEKVALFSKPLHLLAIPLHSSNPEAEETAPEGHSGPTDLRNGVLWITRDGMPFADYERKALEQTCVALGSALSRAWKIYLSDSLWKARTEAITVSRYQHGKRPGQRGISHLVDFDQAALDFFGGKEEDLRGLDVSRLYLKPDYKRLNKDLAAARQRGEHEWGPVYLKIRRLDGSFRPAATSYRLVTSPFVSIPTHYPLSLLRDTSAREKVLAQHKRLVELLDERGIAYFATTKEGTTRESSKAEQRMLGYGEMEIFEIQRSALYPKVKNQQDLYKEAIYQDGKVVRTVQDLKRKSGKLKVSGFIRLLKNELGEHDGFEGFYEDASDKIKLQALLDLPTNRLIEDRELYEKLKENTRLNLDYMTSLSHQIRTPLGALTHNLEEAKKWIPGESPLWKQMSYLIGQTRVCNMLAQNLSYIDRILKGEEFKRVDIELARMLIETKLDFKHTLESEGLKMNIDSESISRFFREFGGSPELFRQVIVNLVDNAIKYSKPGTSIEVVASTGRYSSNLNISNIGIPIPVDERKAIFNRGYRNPVAAASKDGTGLGLWIAKKIVELHDGEISCSAESCPEHNPMAKVAFQLSFSTKKANAEKASYEYEH